MLGCADNGKPLQCHPGINRRTMSPLSAFANTAEKVVLDAGRIALQDMKRLDRIKVIDKGDNNFVSQTDLVCENEILYQLRKAYPHHAVWGEEGGLTGAEEDEYCWLVDPIDGTTNFIRGIPHFAVSLALLKNNVPVVGAVFDPCKNELFMAIQGNGATLNQRRIRVSEKKTFQGALLGTGIPYSADRDIDMSLHILKAMIHNTAGVRRAGAASLDLAYVAAGRLDGFWEFQLKPWDIAAGILLVQESGGLVSDMAGEKSYLKSGDTLAATPDLAKKMLERINQVTPTK